MSRRKSYFPSRNSREASESSQQSPINDGSIFQDNSRHGQNSYKFVIDKQVPRYCYQYVNGLNFQATLSVSVQPQNQQAHRNESSESQCEYVHGSEESGQQNIQYDQSEQPSHISYEHSSDYNISHEESSYNYDSSNSHHHYPQQSPPGLSRHQIDLIPIIKWSSFYISMNGDEKCPICLNLFALDENLRVLQCLHRYHLACLDQWLENCRTCPTCRSSVDVEQFS